MTTPLLRLGDMLRYDRNRGLVLALDLRLYPAETRFIECGSLDELVQTVAQLAMLGGAQPIYLASYGLALVARQWRTRPANTRYAAIIQAAERLRSTIPASDELAALLDAGLLRADAALVGTEDLEQALTDFVDGKIVQYDKT